MNDDFNNELVHTVLGKLVANTYFGGLFDIEDWAHLDGLSEGTIAQNLFDDLYERFEDSEELQKEVNRLNGLITALKHRVERQQYQLARAVVSMDYDMIFETAPNDVQEAYEDASDETRKRIRERILQEQHDAFIAKQIDTDGMMCDLREGVRHHVWDTDDSELAYIIRVMLGLQKSRYEQFTKDWANLPLSERERRNTDGGV